MSAVPYAGPVRRGLTVGVAVVLVGAVAVAALSAARLAGWSPLGKVHVHLPAVSKNVPGPAVSTIIEQQVRSLGTLEVEQATYAWSHTTSSSHRFLGVTTGTSHHTVSLVGEAVFTVDLTRAGYALPGGQLLVLFLPPPGLSAPPTINPASQTQIDACTSNLLLNPWVTVHLSRSCPADALAYQTEAQQVMAGQAAHDAATIDAGRAQLERLVSCLVAPTGWRVSVQWTDLPDRQPWLPDACPAPLAEHTIPTTPTGAP